jgi:hypothetical protein
MKIKPMKLPVLFTAFIMVATVHRSAAQTDPHFTQNYTYPMYLNPALTGSSDGEYRVSAIYRSQWGSVGNPYRTTGASFDTRTNKNVALGLNIMNQSAGDGGFNYFNAYALCLLCRLVLSIVMWIKVNLNGVNNGILSRVTVLLIQRQKVLQEHQLPLWILVPVHCTMMQHLIKKQISMAGCLSFTLTGQVIRLYQAKVPG